MQVAFKYVLFMLVAVACLKFVGNELKKYKFSSCSSFGFVFHIKYFPVLHIYVFCADTNKKKLTDIFVLNIRKLKQNKKNQWEKLNDFCS